VRTKYVLIESVYTKQRARKAKALTSDDGIRLHGTRRSAPLQVLSCAFLFALLLTTVPHVAGSQWSYRLVAFPEAAAWQDGETPYITSGTFFLLGLSLADQSPIATSMHAYVDARLTGPEIWVFLKSGDKLKFSQDHAEIPIELDRVPIQVVLTATTPATEYQMQLQLLKIETYRDNRTLDTITIVAWNVSPAFRSATQAQRNQLVTFAALIGSVGAMGGTIGLLGHRLRKSKTTSPFSRRQRA
jgi:hypothetical protein